MQFKRTLLRLERLLRRRTKQWCYCVCMFFFLTLHHQKYIFKFFRGIIIGCILGLLIIVGCVYCIKKSKHAKKQRPYEDIHAETKPPEPNYGTVGQSAYAQAYPTYPTQPVTFSSTKAAEPGSYPTYPQQH